MGITTVVKEDFEADDILATLARQGREQGFKVLVVSGDRDSIQLVTDDVTLLYPSTQGVTKLTRYDPAKVEERYSVRPEQYPDVAALVGEKSDNLPGVPKVGEKTAAKWLAQYGSLQGILDHADEIGGKVGESFREHRENAVRNRKLNRLIDDVELPVAPEQLSRGAIDADAVREIFTKLQFRTLQDRVLKLADEAGEDIAPAEAVAAPVRPELLDEELEQWLDKAVAATPEGLGLTVLHSPEGGIVAVGVSSAAETTELRWIPERVDYAPFEAWLASDAPKLMFDAKPQLKALTVAGLEVGGQVKDGQLAGWLYRPRMRPSASPSSCRCASTNSSLRATRTSCSSATSPRSPRATPGTRNARRPPPSACSSQARSTSSRPSRRHSSPRSRAWSCRGSPSTASSCRASRTT